MLKFLLNQSKRMANLNLPTPTALTELLRSMTDAQRERVALAANTSVAYLYNLAGCHRTRMGLRMGLAIEDASAVISKETNGATPVVTARQLATMCELCQFTPVTD